MSYASVIISSLFELSAVTLSEKMASEQYIWAQGRKWKAFEQQRDGLKCSSKKFMHSYKESLQNSMEEDEHLFYSGRKIHE